jgi:hypothetical protein
MPIPERLRPPPPTAEELAFYTDLCRQIENLRDAHDERFPELFDRWNARAGREYDLLEFPGFHGMMKRDQFVDEMLMGRPHVVADLTYAELRDVLAEVLAGKLPWVDAHYFLSWLDANLPGGYISDLIYWPNDWFHNDDLLHLELTHDQALAYAMAKSGRRLPDAPEDVPLPYPIPT